MKRVARKRLGLMTLIGLSATGFLLGQDIPLRNWTVHRPSLTKQADITRGIAFVGVDPCRIADTRGVPGGPTPPYAGPALAPGVIRDFDIDSAPTCPGIPPGVEAYSLNLTVTQTQGPGDLRTWPSGSPAPLVSTLNYLANETIANAAIVPAGTAGAISVLPAVSGTHLIIDINGYFTDEYNANGGFEAIGSSTTQLGLFSNLSTAGNTYGLFGRTASIGRLSAGVKGVDGTGEPFIRTSPDEPASGVLGLSKRSIGVYGISERVGVEGHIHGSAGEERALGRLGYHIPPSTFYGVYSQGDLRVDGNMTATGMKSFVEPHRTDASKAIRYIAVEAPAAEIYFRGTAQVSRGTTRIEVPAHFRQVARPGSYTTMVTPVGSMATVGVLSEGQDGIVIRASRNVKVHYVVHAERDAFKDHNPIAENIHFRPPSPEGFGLRLPEAYREIMIQNGTLNPDGTVNLTTAERLGWDKLWTSEESHHPGKER